jgi:glycosyltransferase involved in cell wall biosynthesis
VGKFNFIYYGAVDDIRVSTGIAWHVCNAAQRLGLLGRKFGIDMAAMKGTKRAYALKQLLRGQAPTGYQWSRDNARACTAQLAPHRPFELPVLSCQTPVLDADRIPADARIFFYIDATTQQLVEHYDLGKRVSARTLPRIHEQFRRNVHRAGCVMTRSQWARDSLIHDFGLPESRAVVVSPGCNISCELLDESEDIIRRERERLRKDYDFVVNYCGIDWKRKGLDVLLETWKRFTADNRGRFLLRVMGPAPADLATGDTTAVEFTGRFDKLTDGRTYITRLACADVFCLPTRSDATPQVLIESIRMGTPVVASKIGGIPEMVHEGVNGLLIDEKVAVEPYLAVLNDLYRNRDRLAALREGVDRTRHEYDWQRAVKIIARHMGIH